MNKRGQIYILAAIILAFVFYLILTPSNIIHTTTPSTTFDTIGENFDREAAYFLNYLIQEQEPVYDSFLNFTVVFSSYTKTKNPDVGLIYTFINDDSLYLGNYGEDTVTFDYGATPITMQGCLQDIATSFSVAGLELIMDDIDLATYQSCLQELPITPINDITITIAEEASSTTFTTDIAPNNPDLIIIAKEKKGNTRRVYTKGKFIY